MNVGKVFSISTGIGVAKGILISLRNQRKRPEVNGSNHLNMIFNELIENVEQMKVKNQKQSDLEISLDLKIYFIYIVYLHRMKKNPPS